MIAIHMLSRIPSHTTPRLSEKLGGKNDSINRCPLGIPSKTLWILISILDKAAIK